MLWPIIWMVFMLGLVVAMVVAAVMESGARKKAMANMQPQPLDNGMAAGQPMGGMSQPEDAFGTTGEDDFASFDEDAFN